MHTLQSLDVQQWDERLGWGSVGLCRDVGPISTVEWKSNETIQSFNPIGDISHGWNSVVCPRKMAHLGGKVRAILYYAYERQEQHVNRGSHPMADKFVPAPLRAVIPFIAMHPPRGSTR